MARRTLPGENVLLSFRELTSEQTLKRCEAAQNIAKNGDDYAWKRLVRGLASSNEFARRGFTLGLIHALRSNALSAKDVRELVKSLLEVRGSSRESREARLGRIFCVAALMQSGIGDDEDDTISWAVRELHAAASSERGLADVALELGIQLNQKFPSNQAIKKEFSKWGQRETSDGAAISILTEQAEPTDVGKLLLSWFDLGFIMDSPPCCWRFVVEEAGKSGRIQGFWKELVEPQLIRSRASEKRKMGLRLVPFALKSCKTGKDVECILAKQTVQLLLSMKNLQVNLVDAVSSASKKTMLAVARVLGRLGGFDEVVVAAVKRMTKADQTQLISTTKEWEQIKALSTLACVWKARGGWQEDVAQEMLNREGNSTAVRLAAEENADGVFAIYRLMTGKDVSPEADNRRKHTDQILICGAEVLDEPLDEDASVEEKIVGLLQKPNSALRAIATLAWSQISGDVSWETIQPLLMVLDPDEDEDAEDGDDEEMEDDEEASGDEEGSGSEEEEASETEVDQDSDEDDADELNEEENLEKENEIDGSEDEEESPFLADIDLDDEDPAILAKYDEMLGNVVKHVRVSEKQRLNREAELRSQAKLKVLDLVSLLVGEERKKKADMDLVLLLIPKLVECAILDPRTAAKIESILMKKILKSPSDFSNCKADVISTCMDQTSKVCLGQDAKKASAVCERALNFLMSVSFKAHVDIEAIGSRFTDVWKTVVSSRKDLGISGEFAAKLAGMQPEIVLSRFEDIYETAVNGKTSYVSGVANKTLAATLRFASNQGIQIGPENYALAESAFCKSAEKDGDKLKVVRCEEILSLAEEIVRLGSDNHDPVKMKSALERMQQWDVCTSQTGIKLQIENLLDSLEQLTEENPREETEDDKSAGKKKSKKRKSDSQPSTRKSKLQK